MWERLDAFIIGLIVSVFIYVAVSCGTRPVVVATDESIVASQISAERIEAVNGELRTILQLHDEYIRREIELARRGNYDAETALDLYDQFVQDLINRVRELEFATRIGEGESQGTQ